VINTITARSACNANAAAAISRLAGDPRPRDRLQPSPPDSESERDGARNLAGRSAARPLWWNPTLFDLPPSPLGPGPGHGGRRTVCGGGWNLPTATTAPALALCVPVCQGLTRTETARSLDPSPRGLREQRHINAPVDYRSPRPRSRHKSGERAGRARPLPATWLSHVYCQPGRPSSDDPARDVLEIGIPHPAFRPPG
jgi:hypothetical protein